MNELTKIKQTLHDHEKRILQLEGKTKTSKKIHSKPSKPMSIMDYLMELKINGFFDQPKFLNEIIKELSRGGHHYRASSLTNPILRAVRQRKLGRITEGKKWKYVSR